MVQERQRLHQICLLRAPVQDPARRGRPIEHVSEHEPLRSDAALLVSAPAVQEVRHVVHDQRLRRRRQQVEAGSVLAQLRHRLKVSGPRAALLDVLASQA
jgi:hypothetical protein